MHMILIGLRLTSSIPFMDLDLPSSVLNPGLAIPTPTFKFTFFSSTVILIQSCVAVNDKYS